jgi:hypothetical protein
LAPGKKPEELADTVLQNSRRCKEEKSSPVKENKEISFNTNIMFLGIIHHPVKKIKAIPVTGRGGPYGCERSRLSHFLDIWLTDDRVIVSLTHWPPFTPRKILGTPFC